MLGVLFMHTGKKVLAARFFGNTRQRFASCCQRLLLFRSLNFGKFPQLSLQNPWKVRSLEIAWGSHS